MLHIIMFLALLLTPLTVQATTLFSEDFEVANVAALSPKWFDVRPGSAMSIVTTTGHTGASTKALRLTYTGVSVPGQDGSNAAITAAFTSVPEIWWRYWVRYTATGSPTGFGSVTGKQHFPDVGEPVVFVLEYLNGNNRLMFQNETATAHLCPNGSTDFSCNYFPNKASVPMTYDVWHCVEPHLSQSGIELWVDGIQTLLYNDSTLRFRGFYSTLQIYKQYADNVLRDEDDLVVATTRIGGCGTPVADTVPPNVPTGLTATASGSSVSVQWTASTSSDVANYPILRCTGASCTPSTVLQVVNAPTVSFVDTTVVAGVIYNYAVKAVDTASPANISALTTAVQITAPTTFRRTLSTFTCGSDTITDIGSAWDAGYSTKTNLGCTSGRLRAVSTVTTSLESFNTGGAIGDQWAQVTVFTLPTVSTSDISVAVRMADAATNSYYACRLDNATPKTIIEKRSSGTGSSLTTTAAYDAIWSANDKIRCEATGTAPVTIKFYRIAAGTNVETLVLSDATDSAFATGKTGLRLSASIAVTSPEVGGFAMGDFQAAAAVASVTYDAVSSSATGNTTNSATWNHTVGSGTNRFLLVCTQGRDTVAGDVPVLTVTSNGLALTKVREDIRTSGGDSFGSGWWYLKNPGSGTNAIVVTWTNPLAQYGVGSAVSFSGVDQTAPVDANAGNTGSGTTASVAITTSANHALITDCVADQSNPLTIGAGQTSRVLRDTTGTVDGVGVSTVGDKTPAGAETMDWTTTNSGNWAISAVSLLPATVTPIVEPNILTMTLGVSGSTAISGITYNETPPTQLRLLLYTNTGIQQSIVRPLADFAGGNFSYTWPNGYDGACLFPINSLGVEINTPNTVFQCRSPIPGTSAADTTPIVMTQSLPTGTLNKDTTTTTFALTVDKSGTVKWDTVNTTYALMANTMSFSSFTASASTGAILSNGTTTHVYAQACFTNSVGTDICTTTALDIPISVAAGVATDTTAPTAPTNLAAGTPFQNQVPLSWGASTDAVGVTSYQVFTDVTGLCTTWTAAGLPVTTTTTIYNLPQSTPISFMVRGRDAAGNVSSDSNCTTSTTLQSVDVTPPSTMTNLQVVVNLKASIVLGYDQGTDDRGAVTAIIEQCTGAGCTNFAVVHAPQVGLNQVLVNLTPGTAYRLRGLFSDPSGNVSVAYSNIVDVTTMTTGLPQLRTALPFGVTRTPRP